MADRLPPAISDFDPCKNGSQPPNQDPNSEISARQRRLWNLFQHTATSLTHLYKCKSKCQTPHQTSTPNSHEDQESWLAFQSAASTLTSLYRESADILSALERPSSSTSNSSISSTIVTSDMSNPTSLPTPWSTSARATSLNSSSNNGFVAPASLATTPNGFVSSTASKSPNEKSESNNSKDNNEDSMNFEQFLNSCTSPRYKRSWSPWSHDDDMDNFGGGGGSKRRKFL